MNLHPPYPFATKFGEGKPRPPRSAPDPNAGRYADFRYAPRKLRKKK